MQQLAAFALLLAQIPLSLAPPICHAPAHIAQQVEYGLKKKQEEDFTPQSTPMLDGRLLNHPGH